MTITPEQEIVIAKAAGLLAGLCMWCGFTGKASEAGRILFACSLMALLLGLH